VDAKLWRGLGADLEADLVLGEVVGGGLRARFGPLYVTCPDFHLEAAKLDFGLATKVRQGQKLAVLAKASHEHVVADAQPTPGVIRLLSSVPLPGDGLGTGRLLRRNLSKEAVFSLRTGQGRPAGRPYGNLRGVAGRLYIAVHFVLDGLDLGKLRVSLSQTPTAVIGLGMFIAVARKRGIAIDQLSGTVQNDPLNMFNAEPFPSLSVEGAMRCCMDIFEFTNKNMPKWHPVLINGYNTKESGATPLQELAFLLANATCYLDEAAKRGLSVDQIAPKFAFYFGVGSSFFEEIAKVRAARCMWARIIRDRYGSANPASMLMRYHVQTCGSTLTRQQPLNNVVRCTLQALSAVLGGVSSLHVDSYDEAFAAPSEKAALLSIRTQQIIAEETGVTDVIDPLAGSYYVESLTQEMMRGAQAYLDRIDALGGVLNCVKNHFFTREIAAAAQKYQKEIDRGERTIVGVNAYRTEEEDPIDVYKPDPEIRRQAIERIQKLRATRDQQRWKEALDNVREAAKSKDNLVPAVVEACEAYATFAEIRNVLKEVYGEYEFPAIY